MTAGLTGLYHHIQLDPEGYDMNMVGLISQQGAVVYTVYGSRWSLGCKERLASQHTIHSLVSTSTLTDRGVSD